MCLNCVFNILGLSLIPLCKRSVVWILILQFSLNFIEFLGEICAHLLHVNRLDCRPCLTFQLTLRPEQTVLPLVDKSNTVETRRGVTFQHPEILAHADLVTSTVSEPYYWRLPEQFRGSMVRKPLTPTGSILNVADLLQNSGSPHTSHIHS